MHPALAAHGWPVSGVGDQPALAFSMSALMPLDLWLCRHALACTNESEEHTYSCLDHTFGTGGGKAGLNFSDAPALLNCLQDPKKSIPTRVQEPSLCSSTKSCLGVLGAAAYPSLTTPALAHRLRCRDCVQQHPANAKISGVRRLQCVYVLREDALCERRCTQTCHVGRADDHLLPVSFSCTRCASALCGICACFTVVPLSAFCL